MNTLLKHLLISIFFLMTGGCSQTSEQTNPIVEDISESVYASGIIKSKNQYQVYSTVNGLIQEVLVSEGDTVKKGDGLLKILNEPSKINVTNARLNVENADLLANTDKLNEAEVTTTLALSKLKNDSMLFARQKKLNAQGVGSLIELEQRQLAYENSITNYSVSRLRYKELQRQLEFASNQSKNNLKLSTVLAQDYLIKAETSGRVYKILKEKGELVNTQSPVAIVGDAHDFLIELVVDEFDISRIQKGQKIILTMDSYKGMVFEAQVDKIEPLMNEQSRSFTVKAIFVTQPDLLYPNLSAEANIIIQTKKQALTIPRNYLIADSLVIVNKNEKRAVTVGLMDYQKVEIRSGLTATDIIYKPNP